MLYYSNINMNITTTW